jgi:hypothetical protein
MRLFICLYVTQKPLKRFSWNLIFGSFKFCQNIQLKLDENNCYFAWPPICIPVHILSTIHSVFNQIKCPSCKQVVDPNEIYILFQMYFLCNSHGWNDFDKLHIVGLWSSDPAVLYYWRQHQKFAFMKPKSGDNTRTKSQELLQYMHIS